MPRRTLCFDTSARDFSVALLEGEQLVAEMSSSAQSGQGSGSRSLAPSIQKLLGETGWKIGDLDGLVLPIGPGSFSGLRMGLVTAKVLAYSSGLPIFGLNTLAIVAFKASLHGAVHSGDEVVSLLDAQRGELFAQRFSIDATSLPKAMQERHVIRITELEATYPKERLTGSGLQLIARSARRTPSDEASAERWKSLGQRIVPEQLWLCDAVTAGIMTERLGDQVQPLDYWTIVPDYGRPSAAEEKAIERELSM